MRESAPNAGDIPITLTLTLKRDDQAGFERYRNQIDDPHSPNFRHFLTQTQIAARFGPSQRSYDKVLAYLRANGFELIEGSSNHLTITVRGTRAEAERAFHARIADFRIGKKTFFANQAEPAMPAAIAASVQSVTGLSNYARPQPTHIAIFSAVCAIVVGYMSAMFGLDPNTAAGKACILSALAWCINSNAVAAGYGVLINAKLSCPPLQNLSTGTLNDAELIAGLNGAPAFAPAAVPADVPAAASPWPGVNGAGQTIGLVEFDSYNTSDVADYLNLTGAPASELSNLSKVDVDGGTAPGSGEDEVLLDIDTAMTIANGAKVVVYDAPFSGAGTSFQHVFNAAVTGGATIISNSWAYCEDETTQADADSIDTIFQNAAVSNISIFNGAGDSGSTCLDGAANTVAVPADSPNATAVGGSSLSLGDGATYGSESWWDDSATTPVAGQGGFGVSKFFTAPGYQKPFVAMRSIPDVVANADPFHGVEICQADKGGCPSGLEYGGTSMSAPEWAGFTALLNQSQGKNLGFLNPLIYPFSATAAFHAPASMSPPSDFAHVGLGSPDLPVLNQMLAHASIGAVDASKSRVVMTGKGAFVPEGGLFPAGEPADGNSKLFLSPHLYDSNGNVVSGKTVTVTAQGGNHATITPANAMTGADGTALFTVKDSTIESLTFTVKDTTDGITLTQTPQVPFVSPLAASAGISGGPSSVAADGTSIATIDVTLKDANGHATPGKLVTLSQGAAASIISGPNPSVTDATGKIQFTTTDVMTEDITYTATDVTDGNLPVPGNVQVSFGSGSGCSSGIPMAAPGYLVNTFVTALVAQNYSYGGINFGCFGGFGFAFDPSGNLFVADSSTGNIYKFGKSGGMAGAGTLVTPTPLGASLQALAFDKSGNLYAARSATTGGYTTGDVIQVNPSTGALMREISTGLTCPVSLVTDPISGDLFFSDGCTGGGGDSTAIGRISNPSSGSPTTTVYANTIGTPNWGLTFASDGTLYAWSTTGFDATPEIVRITGTGATQPPTVTVVPNVTVSNVGVAVGGKQASGDAQLLILSAPAPTMNIAPPRARLADSKTVTAGFLPTSRNAQGDIAAADTLPAGVQTFDLVSDAPGVLLYGPFTSGDAPESKLVGPDGCLYESVGSAIYRVTDSNGICSFAPKPLLTISLTPTSANPTQGDTQNITATFLYGAPPAGTPVELAINGVNNLELESDTGANGQATFSYMGTFAGVDNLVASATVNSATNTSNPTEVTWAAGKDHAFLTVDLSPKTGTPGQTITLTASLTDVSQKPPVPIVGQSVMLKLGKDSCSASTDSNGKVSCQMTPIIIPGNPSRPLSADFAGTGSLTSAHASAGFMFTAPPENAKLAVTPKTLHFPSTVELGGVGVTSKALLVHVSNPKNKKQKLTVTFLGAEDTGDFTIVSGPPTTCNATLAAKASSKIALTFSPTGAGARKGTLMVLDNAEINNAQMVKLVGKGAQGKLTFSPGTLNFGGETVHSTSNAKTVNIANKNPIPMAFLAAASGDYQIAGSSTCPANTLPAKSTCKIEVTFTPQGMGSRPGMLTFTDSALKSPQHVKLEGTGN